MGLSHGYGDVMNTMNQFVSYKKPMNVVEISQIQLKVMVGEEMKDQNEKLMKE